MLLRPSLYEFISLFQGLLFFPIFHPHFFKVIFHYFHSSPSQMSNPSISKHVTPSACACACYEAADLFVVPSLFNPTMFSFTPGTPLPLTLHK